MTFDGNIDMLQMAFWQIILASAPVLLIALAIFPQLVTALPQAVYGN